MAPRTRHTIVVASAVAGASAIAFGTGAFRPSPDGLSDTTAALTKTSPLSAGESASAGDGTTKRADAPRASRAQRRAGTPVPQAMPEWVRPAEGPISSLFAARWGTFHKGIDIAAPFGSTVRAASAGTIKFADWNGGYGKLVIID